MILNPNISLCCPLRHQEWRRLNGKSEEGQTIRHITADHFRAIVDDLCVDFCNPRWAWESEIKVVEKNHIDELVKQSKRKKSAEKTKKLRQNIGPGDWKQERVPEDLIAKSDESQTIGSWPRLKDAMKRRKTTQYDIAHAMMTSFKERRSWECPSTPEAVKTFMGDCPAYRRIQVRGCDLKE